jgi:type I restriction enzyme S subunit
VEIELGDHVYIAGRIGWLGLKAEEYTPVGPILLSVPNLNHGDDVNFGKVYHITQARYDESPEIQLVIGDTLLVKDGAGIGKLGFVANLPGPTTVNSSLLVVRPANELLTNKYLFCYLKGPKFQEIALRRISGSATPHLFQKDIKKLQVLAPPRNEQRRIVAKLETLLSKVGASQQRLAKIPVLLKRFRQSVLAAACSGRLTADWRGEHPGITADGLIESLRGPNGNPSHGKRTKVARLESLPASDYLPDAPATWKWILFGEMLLSIRTGSTAVPQTQATEFPILRSSAVRPRCIDLRNVKFLDRKQSARSENFLVEGDLLFTRLSGSIEYVANCALVRRLDGHRIQYPDRLFCAKLKEPGCAEYVEIAFANPMLRNYLEIESKSSAGHQRISMGALTKFPVPLPPLEEQREIGRRVEGLFKLADAIERRFATAANHIDKLAPAILAKAFRGELVPTESELAKAEGRSFESADELLERIGRNGKSELKKATVNLARRKLVQTNSKKAK